MGWIIVVIGLLFLVAGLVISLWEAFGDMGRRVEDIVGEQVAASTADGLVKLVRALARLLEAFAKLTVGIQLSLVGLVLIYCGLRVLGMLPV